MYVYVNQISALYIWKLTCNNSHLNTQIMSLWKGTQSRGSRLQTLHGTETILSSSHCLSLLRPDPQVPASHIYTSNCEVRCMKRLNVKQCHTETTKTASASRHSTYVCVLWNHSKPVFFFFLKMLVLKITNLPDTCHSHTVTNSGQTWKTQL